MVPLDLTNFAASPCHYIFPNNLNVFKTLLVLKLKGRTVLDVVDSPVCFPSLKTLHLTYVRFERKESFKIILSACPVLEDLVLEALRSAGDYLFPISLSSPSLQRLSIDTKYGYYHDNDPILEISAPSLKYLKICDIRACYNLIEDMPKLVEANVSVDLPRHEHLFKVLSSLERLSIGFHAAMVVDLTDGLIFNRLLHLELDINYAFCSNLLLRLLRHFPNIQSLKLLRTYLTYWRGQLNCLVSVPKCLSFHLEILQWTCYGGALNEREAAVYIFKNAPYLKTATFSLCRKDMEDVMMKDLRSMPKASASCQLVFKKTF
ncbi:unnamed protein product [Eruca vesicaria subsp. sativa]|uniref:FBD domain-containing protein n=1 Tax=Eruca vesicaria subsp. sativa TaxID=29727 RepID=A0ABC8M148_ERUVS|nr:unnamed protein product [Eruca vesicaria subsp. sativa]